MGLPSKEVIKALAAYLEQPFKLRALYLASLKRADDRLALCMLSLHTRYIIVMQNIRVHPYIMYLIRTLPIAASP